MRDLMINWYLDYVNNWLTVEAFAEYYGLTAEQAKTVIELGKTLHETPHPSE